MLEIKKSNYEIDEKIRLLDSNDEIVYEFDMQITGEELLKIKKMLFEKAEKRYKEYKYAQLDEKKKIEKEVDDEIKKKSEEFENICFKEHKDKFKELAGDYKYEETVDMMINFFIKFFVEKQMKPINTTLMNLKKHLSN